jgi:SRSO17 transposase
MQAKRKNMERMEEAVVEADEQRLQHMLTDSDWEQRAVLDQVAREANGWLGGTADSCFLLDESGFAKKGRHSVGVARQWNGRQVTHGFCSAPHRLATLTAESDCEVADD